MNGPILQEHWRELALDQDKIGLSFDTSRYETLDRDGTLFIATLRDGIELAGYFVFFLVKHMHYDQAGLMAYIDVYYLRHAYRKGGAGARLLKFAESELRARRVSKIYLSCKVHQDHSALFKALGYVSSDYVFTKAF